jgi:inositol phosphorylceramide synthase catalytic subunit
MTTFETLVDGERIGDARIWRTVSLVLFPAHALVAAATIGLRWEHVVIDVSFLLLALVGPRSRRFSLAALPMVIAAFQYDFLVYLWAWAGPVHVGDMFDAELRLFGLRDASGVVIPSAWFATRTNGVLDFVCGLAYLLYIPASIVTCVVLWWLDRSLLPRFALAYWLLNTMAVTTWFLFPVAPPWYVALYGFGPAVLDAAPYGAGALRFDALLGIHFFERFYSRCAWIFGAFPSLHVGDPTVVLLAVRALGWRWTAVVGAYVLLVGFSAIYLGHHYVIDLVAGAVYAVLAWTLAGWMQRWLPGMGAPQGRTRA